LACAAVLESDARMMSSTTGAAHGLKAAKKGSELIVIEY